jgi:LPS O-antigen subunit length determinant protein (WzzB/FepE family)
VNAVTSPQKMQPVANDEIDLVELIHGLWRQKALILSIAFLVGLIGVAYAFLAPRYYNVQSVLRPAALKDLDELNYSGIYELSPEQALQKVGAALDSYENRLGFFRDHPELFERVQQPNRSLEQSFERFNDDAFNMLQPDAKKTDNARAFVGIKLTYPQEIDGVRVVNELVEYSVNSVRQQIAEGLEVIIGNRLNQLEKKMGAARAYYEATKETQIASLTEADNLKRAQLQDELKALRIQLKTQRENRISQLSEAIRIASALNISMPTTPSSLGETERVSQGSVMRTEINNQQIPLYFMGSETLEAERKALTQRRSDDFTAPRIAQIAKELKLLENNRQIEVLNSRKNEDLYLKDLAAWREETARLGALVLDVPALKLVSIDQRAIEPRGPIKPKKMLIIALSLVLGGMLGIFVALVRNLMLRQPVKA